MSIAHAIQEAIENAARILRNIFGLGRREAAVLENAERENEKIAAAQRTIDVRVKLLQRRAREVEAAASLMEGLRRDLPK